MKGRKPIPTALKILNGNPGKRPLNDAEPKPARDLPACPDWLHEYAKAEWAALAPQLHAIGLLTIVDGNLLAAYCQAWAELRLSTEVLNKEGRTAKGAYSMVTHPCVQQQRTAWKAIGTLGALLGLDPSSRSRMRIDPTGGETDPLEAFLNGQQEQG